MRRAILLVSPVLLVDVLKAPRSLRMFDVTDFALPEDAQIVDVRYINHKGEIALELESETFNEVPEKGQPPVLEAPVIQVVTINPENGEVESRFDWIRAMQANVAATQELMAASDMTPDIERWIAEGIAAAEERQKA